MTKHASQVKFQVKILDFACLRLEKDAYDMKQMSTFSIIRNYNNNNNKKNVDRDRIIFLSPA